MRLNRLANNTINGMEVRGGVLTGASVWDDTDIVHVLQSEVSLTNLHSVGGLRLQSSSDASLVVKLLGATSGFTASGRPLDIDDRIGGSVHVVGTPNHPVVLTSLRDDTIGAGLNPLGQPLRDTDNNGATTGAAGQWRSVRLDQFSNDSNVDTTLERESIIHTATPANDTPGTAHLLGELAPNQLSGNDNRRLGFQVHGFVRPGDVDVYSFLGTAGAEIWIDLDHTTPGLDTIVELTDASGNVLARSNDSFAESNNLALLPAVLPGNQARIMQRGDFSRRTCTLRTCATPGCAWCCLSSAAPRTATSCALRSNSTDLNLLNGGRTTGSYDLQIRLQEADEFPGSTVQYSDIRFATTGIEVLGLPKHSPLIGDTGENPADAGNEGQAAALTIGNVLATDRGSLSVSGQLAATAGHRSMSTGTALRWTRTSSSRSRATAPGRWCSILTMPMACRVRTLRSPSSITRAG